MMELKRDRWRTLLGEVKTQQSVVTTVMVMMITLTARFLDTVYGRFTFQEWSTSSLGH